MATPKINGQLMKVTPTLAEQWLGKNVKNRPISRSYVEQLARDMSAGRWAITGDGFRFAIGTGHMLDGQHRASAIVLSGATIESWVFTNCPEETQAVMDTGRKRTAADVLGLSGHTDTNLMASATKLVVLYETGRLHTNATIPPLTHGEILDFIDGNDLLLAAMTLGRPMRARVECQPSALVAAMYECMKVDGDSANEFFARLNDGLNLSGGDPIIALRDRQRFNRRDGIPIGAAANLGLIFRAWNDWRVGKHVKEYRMQRPGGLPFPIPEPK